jgi:UDP-MurNAc hydroxylase
MHFQILSHAGMLIQGAGKTLIFDPWLLGSTYWRSWWNYPPVARSLWENLHPDFIALTHIHWDHFNGVSLRKFSRSTTIIIPRISSRRMKHDLMEMGFINILEIKHGAALTLAPGFTFTSYQFYPFMNSGVVVECEGVKLFNANHVKFMGGPLAQILKRHRQLDFVFCSHDSANPRICYDYLDTVTPRHEDSGRYLQGFAAFASAVGARYAIPFASNHCYLHREVYHLNDTVVTPVQVADYFKAKRIFNPEVKVMVSGDRWSSERGFAIADNPFFDDRERCLHAYAAEQSPILEKFYSLEAKADVSLAQVEGYFREFIRAIPWIVRKIFKNHPVTYVLTGRRTSYFWIDLYRGAIREVGPLDDAHHPLQIHTSAYILRRCMALNLFLYLGISKRVLFRCRQKDAKYLWLLELLFNLYESQMLPMWKMLTPRFVGNGLPRWRELLLYGTILARQALGKQFILEDYLHPGRKPLPLAKRAPSFTNVKKSQKSQINLELTPRKPV